MTQILRTLLASVVIAATGVGVLTGATDHFRAFTTETARRVQVSEHPVPIPDVTLQTQTGAHIALSSLRGRWLVIDFIYARCPTVCLALGNEFSRLQQYLAEPIAQNKVTLLSISFDPDYDTPLELKNYLERSDSHGSGWLAARPIDAPGLRQLLQRFRVTVIADPFGGYTHNAAIYIVDPQGQLVEIMDQGDPEHVAQLVQQRLQQ